MKKERITIHFQATVDVPDWITTPNADIPDKVRSSLERFFRYGAQGDYALADVLDLLRCFPRLKDYQERVEQAYRDGLMARRIAFEQWSGKHAERGAL